MLCAIPIEIANRELDGVIYLSMYLAKHGLPTLFGERMVHEYLFRLEKGRPVVYFDQEQNVDNNQAMLDNGGIVINLNPEGQNLGLFPQLVEMFARVSHTFSAMFVRGEEQRKVLVDAFPDDKKDCVVASGHPSFDLLNTMFRSYHEQAEVIDEHGEDYILINTHFASFNHKMGFENYMRMVSKLKEWKDLYADESFMRQVRSHRDFEEKVANEYVRLARRIAEAYPDRHVILRPHPMEGTEYYASRLSDVANIFVTNEGPVRAWLTSAGWVVHHSCTTGVEALLMGKSVIRFDPVPGETVKNTQALAGVRAETVEQVVAFIEGGGMSEDEQEKQIVSMRPHIANFGVLAAPVIASYVADLAAGKEAWLPGKVGTWEGIKCWRKYASKLLRSHQPGRNGRKVRYALDKFPRLPLEEVVSRIERMRSCDADLPEVRVTQLALNTFLMEAK